MKIRSIKLTQKLISFLFIIGFIAIIVFPFYWQVITSLKAPADISKIPTDLWPTKFSLEFYGNVFTHYKFEVYLKNSIIVGTVTMLISILFAVPAAYAFVRIDFKYKKFWRNFLLIANMFPIIAMVSPLFEIFKKYNLINTYAGLIIPSIMITLPLAIWTLIAFISKIPIELEEAARVDGTTRFQSVMLILLPLMGPGLFSTAIISFITAWNELMFSLLMVTKNEMRTVPVGISMFSGQFTVPWGDMSAASIVSTLPIILVVLIFQKKIVAGLTAGAVKG